MTVVADPQQLRARADAVLELHEDGDLGAALTACERLLEDVTPEDAHDPVLRETLFTARFERALLLTELGELTAAADAYADAAATPADPTTPTSATRSRWRCSTGGSASMPSVIIGERWRCTTSWWGASGTPTTR
jgi:hypothetical protein